MADHSYQLLLKWTGNVGKGTQDYRSYERSYLISNSGKPDLMGSSDPLFRGDPKKYNPEELLLASLSACHMLWYLHLCSENKIVVKEYTDQPTALMVIEASGRGYFKEATLQPNIIISGLGIDKAESLHEIAHKKCFIANSVNFPVAIHPTIQIE